MVEYIKSSGGYFYKVYKNGEKKRISKEEYHKKIKIVGKGSSFSLPQKKVEYNLKSEQEIIEELKNKKKYDEWVKKGSHYGWLLPEDSTEKHFIWKDVDGKEVKVITVFKEFNREQNIVPVFEFVRGVEDPSYVKQGTFKIVNNNETLQTSGLASCSALVMEIGNKKFMTHLDALTNIEHIIEALKKTIQEQKINISTIKATIYAGLIYSNMTIQKANEICAALNISKENITTEYVCLMDYVNI